MRLYANLTNSKGKKEGIGDNEYLEVMLSDRNQNRFLISFDGNQIQIMNYFNGAKTLIEYSPEPRAESTCNSIKDAVNCPRCQQLNRQLTRQKQQGEKCQHATRYVENGRVWCSNHCGWSEAT